MVYHGRVQNGVVVLNNGSKLAEGTEVEVQLLEETNVPTIAERFADIIGKAKGLPEDFAENHDHYIHGAPKKTL